MAEIVVCPSCGAENAADQRFCGSCGSALVLSCPNCGEANPVRFAFCGACGTPLTAPAAPAAPERREERRLATVVFADLSGFTALSEGMDPEDVRSLVDSCAAALTEIVERYGGTVDKVIGDAVMAVFGAPVTHEDDPERAVRAALDMQVCAREKRDLFGGLTLRIGVNTGETMFAPVGPRGEFTVMGDTVNTAARLQAAAPRSGVVVGRETHLATINAIEYEELPPVEAKGKEAPVPAWRALAARGAPAERPTSAVPLVGRSAELELLRSIWERVRADRHAHLVTIIGPPGIGKSRLVREVAGTVEKTGPLLRGRCLPYGETTGYGAFGQQVKQAAGILESDPVPLALEKLERRVGELIQADEATEVSEHLAILVGLSAEGAPDKQPLFSSARRFVEGLARERPIALAFEDIHWAEPSLLELVHALAARAREAPVLLLTLARPELLDQAPTWGGGLPRYTAIALEPLPDEEARRLAVLLLSRSERAEEAVDDLVRTGGGNPLFLEELAASLAERATETTAHLPTTVQAIIAARLDVLPAHERSVLQDAAVIGRVFWRGVLAAISGDGQVLDLALEELEARDFIRRLPTSLVEGDRQFIFKHILTREVAYATLPRTGRRERHAAVAEHLEKVLGDRAREHSSILAMHWKEAGDRERAARYLLTAAEAASRAWAKQEAIGLYSEAIDVLREKGDREAFEEAVLARARTRTDASDYASAVMEDLEPLLESAGGRNLVLAHLLRTRAAMWTADSEGVHRLGQRAATLARQIGDVDLEARALSTLAEGAAMDGDTERGLRLHEQAFGMWPPDRRDGDYGYALSQLGLVHYWRGEAERGVRRSTEAFELGLELSNLFAAVNGAAHAGLCLSALSRYEEALQWFERAVTLGRDWEMAPRFTARAMNMWSGALRELGDLAEARRLSEEALELGKSASFPGVIVSARVDLVFADLVEGHGGRALAAIPDLLETVEATRGWHQWLWTIRLLEARAEAELLAGAAEEAARTAEEAIGRSSRHGRRKYLYRARSALGRALVRLGREEEAVATLRQVAGEAERWGHVPTLWPALAALAEAHERAGNDAEAELARDRARRAVTEFAAGLAEERRGTLLASPTVVPVLAPRP